MNDTVMTVIAIFLAAILMFMFQLMSTSDSTTSCTNCYNRVC